MNIAFLSSLNPKDIHNWSGTLYFMYSVLDEKNNVTCIGHHLYMKVFRWHTVVEKEQPFEPENYAKVFGMLLSEYFQKTCYDVIICRDYYFLSYLVTETPVVYIGDTTFRLFNDYLHITNFEVIQRNDSLEKHAIQNATHIVYASEWAKASAVRDYGKDEQEVSVIPFGANLKITPRSKEKRLSGRCRLLFIGTNWRMKGGEKVLSVFRKLKGKGIDCHLTIVGSQPEKAIPKNENVQIYPNIDKATEEGQKLFVRLWNETDFLILPTKFDCFGIVLCKACAYSLPVLATDGWGIRDVIKENVNGFLFSPATAPKVWAEQISRVYQDPERYSLLIKRARQEYEIRLNWKAWSDGIEQIFNKLWDKQDIYVPVYAINMKERTERRKHIISQFEGREEFDFHLVEACIDTDGRKGLWKSIVSIVKKAKEDKEQVIIICEDDYYFTKNYSPGLLMYEIKKGYHLGADLLTGGIGGFGDAIPRDFRLYQIDWFWCTQFIVVYSALFDKILSYDFRINDTADGVLSVLAYRKMVIYPFISEQKDFGYSDVTQSNQEYAGRIREHFEWANRRMEQLSLLNSSL